MITAQNQTKVYGQADPQFSFQASGFVGADTLVTDPTCGVNGAHVHVTSYVISCSGAGAGPNYTVQYFPGNLVVTPAPLTITADSLERAYGVANPALTATFTGFQNGDTIASLSGSPSLSTAATSSTDPGRYAISVGQGTLASADYTFTFQPGTLTIDEASVGIVAATVHASQSILNQRVTLSATLTNAATSAAAPGLTALFTAHTTAGKIFQCTGVSSSSGAVSCVIHVGSPLSLRNTTYLVQSQATIDYLPGSGTGNIVN
jgi:hypothetical protein